MTGEDEMQAALKRFAASETSKARKAVKAGGEVLMDELEKNTPIGDGKTDRSWKAQRQTNTDAKHDHLKNDIAAKGVTSVGGEFEQMVGYGSEEGWRAHFPNSGTWKQKPQRFIEKSQAAAKPKVLAKFVEEMRF